MSRSSSSKRKNPFKHLNRLLNVERLEDRTTPSCSAISGFVYHDVNNNGIFDTGESPIANSSVELRDASNQLIASATTNADGFYEFTVDQTKPGDDATLVKTVEFPTTQTNFTLEGMLDQFDPSLGTLTSIEIKHEGSITSEIKVENFSLVSESDISGTISGNLTLLAPGVNNKVEITGYAGSGHLGTYDGNTDFAGTSGTTFGEKAASGSSSITLTGADMNAYIGTGQVKVTETANATSRADGGGNLDARIRSTATGKVSVTYHYKEAECIAPGDYKIIQTQQPNGFTDGKEARDGDVIPNSNTTDFINVTLGDIDLVNNNFGEVKVARISGHVYHDVDNDGVFDAGEDPIAGTKITLTGPNGTKETTTNAAGFYEFNDLSAGTYTVNESQPASFLDGKDTAGTLGGAVTNDQIATIVLQDNQDSQNNDFGELKPASISGHVYFDANDNGIREAAEAPIPGATITLTGFDDFGPVSKQTTTNGLGEYSFNDLRPGTYAVSETQPADYDDGKDQVGSHGGTLDNDVVSGIELKAGDNGVNYDFGEIRPDRPGEPLPKSVQPLGGLLPALNKVQLTTGPATDNIDPAFRASMTFVVGTQITLLGSQPNLLQTMSGVAQLQAGVTSAQYVAALWNTDTHRGIQADRLYQEIFNRAPTAQERADTITALQTTGSQLAVMEQLFVSPAYQQLHPTSGALVQGLFEDILNKVPGTQAANDLLQSMDNQPLNDVVRSLLVSNESLANLIDDAYRQTVRRPATSAEITVWTAPLKAGTMTLDELSQRLLASEEFYQLASVSIR